ncbi:MAG: FN3 domain-containing metallophosphoesterase family protein [Armatimonadota bacterium]
MDRRRFLQVTGTGALIGTIGTAEAQTPAGTTALAPFAFVGAPVLQNLSSDGVTVVWAVNSACTGWVEYGEAPSLGRKNDGADGGLMPLDSTVFKIRLDGLTAGKTYFYRVGVAPIDFRSAYDIRRAEPVYSPTYHFTVPTGVKAGTVSFSVINDTHENQATLQQLMPLLKAGQTDFTFWNGDVFNEIRSETQIAQQFLAPAGAPFAAETPLFLGRGNHDVRGVAARDLHRFVDLPGGRYYYSFRQGPVAFLVLDTGEDKPDSHPAYAGLGDFAAYRTEQQTWLKKAITEKEFRSAPFRVVFAHIPLLGKYHCEDGRAKWHDLLVKGKVDLVISGHTHRFAYHAPEAGRPYGQLIGGGPQVAVATLIRGKADNRELKVTMQKLDGTEVGSYVFPRTG